MANIPMKMYQVCPIYNEQLYSQVRGPTGYSYWRPKNEVIANSGNFGTFFDKNEALQYAKAQASVNGGVELAVMEVTCQFYSKPSAVALKLWKGEELVAA